MADLNSVETGQKVERNQTRNGIIYIKWRVDILAGDKEQKGRSFQTSHKGYLSSSSQV
jgi:hypothetical protein